MIIFHVGILLTLLSSVFSEHEHSSHFSTFGQNLYSYSHFPESPRESIGAFNRLQQHPAANLGFPRNGPFVLNPFAPQEARSSLIPIAPVEQNRAQFVPPKPLFNQFVPIQSDFNHERPLFSSFSQGNDQFRSVQPSPSNRFEPFSFNGFRPDQHRPNRIESKPVRFEEFRPSQLGPNRIEPEPSGFNGFRPDQARPNRIEPERPFQARPNPGPGGLDMDSLIKEVQMEMDKEAFEKGGQSYPSVWKSNDL